MRLVVADDSTVMRRIVIRTLRQAGFDAEVLEVADGRAAYVAAIEEQPDLVLSDWNMPDMTGIESLRAIRAAGSGVLFGFVTSESSEAMRAEAEAAGAAFLITKPFTPETFRDVLSAFV
jgi:two-component system, chemotaxis family, chemotaxis protein CheY